MGKTRIIYMGTPNFSCGMLDALIEMKANVVAVVSQPDKPVGRKRELQETPVKKRAQLYGIPVIQPKNIKEEYEEILKYEPDLIITCAYGQIVPKVILEAPILGCVNIHASLLPKYRGGAPIHMAIINGEKETGITLMYMIEKMDAGAILAQKKVYIEEEDTTESLYDKLEDAGRLLLFEKLDDFIKGKLKAIEQDEAQVSYAWNISKEQEFVSFNRTTKEVYNHIRGLISWPVGYGLINGKKVKFHQVDFELKEHKVLPGTLLGFEDNVILITTKDGYIKAKVLQIEGKSRVSAKEFYNGAGRNLVNQRFE